jgi:enoyl-CoA hydratase/carnithine racemase
MHSEQHVITARRRGHLFVELNRPEAGNALLPEVTTELSDALDRAEEDSECRAFVLASTSPRFCAGADLAALCDEGLTRLGTGYARLLSRLTTSRVPTVALVEGPATGGGVGLAAACDIVIAGPDAMFQLTEVVLGMLPTMLMPFLARRIGPQRALRLGMLASPVSAHESVAMGLADLCRDNPRAEIPRILAALARSPRETIGDLKEAHAVLFSVDDRWAALAERVFGARLTDPAVAQRISSLRSEGLL